MPASRVHDCEIGALEQHVAQLGASLVDRVACGGKTWVSGHIDKTCTRQ